MKESKPVNRLLLALLIVLIVLTGSIAIRIEILNRDAGNYLPRTDYSEHGSNAWRVVSSDERAEQIYREFLLGERLYRDGTDLELDDELFRQQAAEMELDQVETAALELYVRDTRANRRLSEAVLSIGCYQHFLVLLGIVVAIPCFRKKQTPLNLFITACLLILLLAGFLMIYRQYFFATVD